MMKSHKWNKWTNDNIVSGMIVCCRPTGKYVANLKYAMSASLVTFDKNNVVLISLYNEQVSDRMSRVDAPSYFNRHDLIEMPSAWLARVKKFIHSRKQRSMDVPQFVYGQHDSVPYKMGSEVI